MEIKKIDTDRIELFKALKEQGYSICFFCGDDINDFDEKTTFLDLPVHVHCYKNNVLN